MSVDDFSHQEFLEITTKIGCPVKCLKYCPQEIIVKNYKDRQKNLTLDDFKIILQHLPPKLLLVFSGFCEPFANKHAIDLIQFAHATHPIVIYTTLYQASSKDVEELLKLTYVGFSLHLPDGKNMKIPITEQYKQNVFSVIQNIPVVSFAIMNDCFVSNNRENIVRGIYTHKRRFRHCRKWDTPQFVMLPNGDVQICCMDFGLWHKIGNLLMEDYETICQRYRKQKYDLCLFCSVSISLPRYVWKKIVSRFKLHKIFD